MIAFGVLNLIATVTAGRRATAGVSGRSRLRSTQIGAGIGLCATLVSHAAVIVRQQRRGIVRP